MPLPVTDSQLLFAVAIAQGVLLLVVLWLVWAGRRNAREAAVRTETQLAEQHRAMLGDLFGALQQEGDRVIRYGGEGAERLRQLVAAELDGTRDALQQIHLALQAALAGQREDLVTRLLELSAALQGKQDQLRQDMVATTLSKLAEQARADKELLQSGLAGATQQLTVSIESLMRSVNERLEKITGHVNERLDEGFKKTNETFVSVMARLATIDEAQKKIDGLTTNVVSLQELLGDKKSRGAFGEVQLEGLVRNMLPPGSYAFQHTLPNNARADCVLHLPEPTGMVAVDSKFPLENYHRMFDADLSEIERRQAQTAFRADIRKHVDAISSKYLIPNVTSDGAVMFVPAEAVFAEIHAYHAEVVTYAQQKRVWIVSPTTLMAVLNTARAVLKDVETRKQIHLIKDALAKLAKDFNRFDDRMQNLARHIDQANKDVQEVQTSSKKISSHFYRIEQAQVDEIAEPTGAAAVKLLRD
ncbi:MAG: DNA recombination protein RmuC [Rhodocyclaceae bacterium]